MKIYTVLMYRHGDRERHSYLLGVFADKGIAIKAAHNEVMRRHSNYLPHVQEWALNEQESGKTLVPLPDQKPFTEARLQRYKRGEDRFVDFETELLEEAQRQHKERKA